MRILLPPSETKREGSLPGPIALDALVAPALTRDRERVLRTLARYCSRTTPAVRAGIGTTINQDAELTRNASILSAPVAPAYAVYDGVLFDAVGLASLTADHRQRVVDAVLVQSALFGVVGFGDAIPAYRCSADSTLPRLGRMGSYWRGRLAPAMQGLLDDQLVLDMRSGGYASMWSPAKDMLEQVVTIKVMQERDGRRLAVSHFNKATKGQLVAALSAPARAPRNPAEAAEVIASAGFDLRVLEAATRTTFEVLMRAQG